MKSKVKDNFKSQIKKFKDSVPDIMPGHHEDLPTLTIEQFGKLDPSDIEIYVVKSVK